MQENNNRNTIIFVVSAVLILIAYQIFVLEPSSKRRNAEMSRQKAAAVEVQAAQKTGPLPTAVPVAVQPS